MPIAVRCPSCRQSVAWEGNPHRPFCSQRCRLRDLGNWVTEHYRIPSDVPPDGAPSEPESEEDSDS